LLFCGRGTDGAPTQTADPAAHGAPVASIPVATYSDLLGSDRPKQVIRELTATADYVLVDAPPVQVDADACLLAGACDGVLAVATLATATRSDVDQASDQLSRAGARLLGSVLIDPELQTELQETIAVPWPNGARRTNEITNGKARVQPGSAGALTEAVEA
jgi:hypothetical protein